MPAHDSDDSTFTIGPPGSLLIAIAVGLVVQIIAFASHEHPVMNTAIGVLIAGMSGAIGLLLGFLFGIPRSLQREKAHANDTISGDSFAPSYETNTNLEQISDWLTKIIVGVGLVEMTAIPDQIRQMGIFFATAFGVRPVPGALVVAGFVYFSITAFLLSYLWTRLHLTGEFTLAEQRLREQPEYYEGLMHALLYRPMPQGFEAVIRLGDAYRKQFGDNNARILIYLACAYGQKHAYLKRSPSPDATILNNCKMKALSAIDRALQLDPEKREFIESLWDRQLAEEGDDDLVTFFGDPEFEKLLRPKPDA
jgi:hypothetical protein